MKITLPVALGALKSDESRLQLVRVPGGILGRNMVPGLRGRGNSISMMDASDILDHELVKFGSMDIEIEHIREAVDTNGLTGPNGAFVRAALFEAWDRTTIGSIVTLGEWIDGNTVEWPEEPVVADVGDEPTIAQSVGDFAGAAAAIVAAIEGLKPRKVTVGEVLDNPGAYKVPDVDPGLKFIKFDGRDAFDVFDKARANKINCVIAGPTGGGKSYIINQYAASRGLAFAATDFSTATDTTALFDDVQIVGGDSVRALTGVGMVLKYGGVWELREVNAAADDMATALYGPLSGDRVFTLSNGERIPIHPDVIMVATVNPVDSAHSHARVMSAALSRRLSWHLELNYDEELEKELVPSETLRQITRQIRSDSSIKTPFGTDTLCVIHQAIGILGVKAACAIMVRHFRDDDRNLVKNLISVQEESLAREYGVTIESDVPEAFSEDLF